MIRIITERQGLYSGVLNLVNEMFDSYTWYMANGVYKGREEDALVIEIYSDDVTAGRVLAERVRVANNQESVLFAVHETTHELVEAIR